MCFGGGGGSSTPAINFIPQNPYVKAPEPPQPVRTEFKPLQSPDSQPGVRLAGTTRRMQEGYNTTRRRSLSSGLGLSQGQGFSPRGGINL